jgi:hypothetical protein
LGQARIQKDIETLKALHMISIIAAEGRLDGAFPIPNLHAYQFQDFLFSAHLPSGSRVRKCSYGFSSLPQFVPT